jgi:HK97 family phage portal protein
VSLISGDVAKLRAMLMKDSPGGIKTETDKASPFWRVLRKPNHYQTWAQFMRLWIISKLLHGNTYILKVREGSRSMVKQLYVLDPTRVTPMVTSRGDIYYQLGADNLSGIEDIITVPATEIIHDRGACLYHPLVGVSPLVACAYSATQGIKIQRNSATFFKNMSMPSGMLSAPGKIDDETASRLKKHFEDNYSGVNIGRVAVAGQGLDYKLMTIPAEASQLIDQLKWTVEDVARCFLVPLHMIGAGSGQTGANYGVTTQQYYSQTLQLLIEDAEALLFEGLELTPDMSVEFDLEGLMRLDTEARYGAYEKAIKAGWMKPNEPRAKEGMLPVDGGDQCYLQQQNYSLAALAKRDALPDPFATNKPTPPPEATPPETPPPAPEKSLSDAVNDDHIEAIVEHELRKELAERMAA